MRYRARLVAILLSVSCRGGGNPPAPPPLPEDVGATPSTDVYLHRFGQPSVFNITNRAGYDNQPAWDGNAVIMYTRQFRGQTDISGINFETSSHGDIIRTPESEYSAALSPDGESITVVRVERDSAQRLWRFPKSGGGVGAPSLVLRDIKPVGYFAWLDTATLALFVLGNPNTLQIADTRTGVGRIVTTNIGRSLQRVPGSRRASYVRRVDNTWVLETVDPTPLAGGRFHIDTIGVLPDSAEYVSWRSATELYTGAGSRILRMRLPDKRWTVVVDLSEQGIRRISRLAIAPDGRRIAFVADEPVRPR